jgi:uncharacterized protein YdaU (DUF1376 family)
VGFFNIIPMAKDPAFLFYPGDWNLGTMHLTLLEKGCYIELLVLQFAKGKFTEAQAKHMLNGSFDVAWSNLSEKFKTDGEFYWNERLRKEQEKRQNYTESRRSNGLAKKSCEKTKKHMGKHMHNHMDKHMEDENKDINNTISITNNIQEFNTKPISQNFNGLPHLTKQAALEIIFRTQQVKVTDESLTGMWNVFKIQNLTGDNYYPNEGKVYSHFINWIKTQKFNDGNTTGIKPNITKFNAGAAELLKRGKEEFNKRRSAGD